jgi:acylphosphatase
MTISGGRRERDRPAAVKEHMKRTLLVTMALLVLASLAIGARADEPEKVVRKHWFVSGQVQGVGFRAWTYEAATELKLRGWVRNLTDHRVEIVAEGNERAVAALLERVKKGPPQSRVHGIKDAKVDEKERLVERFEIRDSAEPPKEKD